MPTTRAIDPGINRFIGFVEFFGFFGFFGFVEFIGFIGFVGSIEFVVLINLFLWGEKERIRSNVKKP